mmetsp:Transcript_28422/g.54763  ORF Transcript_28422/g.54763 Transcript_28422/m.54763 type:complete len:202 (+) Transcript_28422:275-880(+)
MRSIGILFMAEASKAVDKEELQLLAPVLLVAPPPLVTAVFRLPLSGFPGRCWIQSATYSATPCSQRVKVASFRACIRQPRSALVDTTSRETSQTARPGVDSSPSRSGRPARPRNVEVLPARAGPMRPNFAQRGWCWPSNKAARKASRAMWLRAKERCCPWLLRARLQGSKLRIRVCVVEDAEEAAVEASATSIPGSLVLRL